MCDNGWLSLHGSVGNERVMAEVFVEVAPRPHLTAQFRRPRPAEQHKVSGRMTDQGYCKNCFKNDHVTEECPQAYVMCAKCGGKGHRARSCPSKFISCFLCGDTNHEQKDCLLKNRK